MVLRAVIASVALCISVAQADEPQWLKDARAREGKTVQPQPFKSKDNWFSASVPATVLGEIIKEQESYSIEFDIGGDTPIYCEVVPDGFDMADMLRRTLDLTLKQVEEIQGKIEARRLDFSDAGAVGNVPFLETRWIYRANDGTEPRVGGLKQVAFEKHGHGVYCAHVDIGFAQTFKTVTRALAESFEAPTVAPPPYYMEISTMALGGKKVGIAISRLERDADGDTKATQMAAMLAASPDGSLHSLDALNLAWLRPDASLINGSHFLSEDGELSTKVELRHTDDGWVVQGEWGGKQLDEKLGADAHPGNWVEQALGLRKLLAAKNAVGAEHSIALWTENAPMQLTDVKTRVIAKKRKNEYTAQSTIDRKNAELTLDAKSGMTKAADIPTVGSMTAHFERIYESGSF